jgi:hypothetical protein
MATEDRSPEEGSVDDAIVKGRAALRNARIAASVAVGAIVAHLEWLIYPFAASTDPMRLMLLLGYPIALGYIALSGLFGKSRPFDP